MCVFVCACVYACMCVCVLSLDSTNIDSYIYRDDLLVQAFCQCMLAKFIYLCNIYSMGLRSYIHHIDLEPILYIIYCIA